MAALAVLKAVPVANKDSEKALERRLVDWAGMAKALNIDLESEATPVRHIRIVAILGERSHSCAPY